MHIDAKSNERADIKEVTFFCTKGKRAAVSVDFKEIIYRQVT